MTASLKSYQLHIQLLRPVTIQVGRFGRYCFPAGHYIYTGSAKRNLEARIQRHLSKRKKHHWHIDYLLAHSAVQVVRVQRFVQNECRLNQDTHGKIIVPGFGASDCRRGCGSHLQYLGLALRDHPMSMVMKTFRDGIKELRRVKAVGI